MGKNTLGNDSPRPLHARSADTPEASPEVSTPRRSLAEILTNKNLSILLAEDNRTNQLVATAILETAGCKVYCVANGIEAVEAVKRHSYDLILMDLMMPEMDGIETAQAIKQMGAPFSTIPIIALTANSLSQDRDACRQAGMTGFVAKPFNSAKLADAIDEVFEDRETVAITTLDEMRAIYGSSLPHFAALFLEETSSRIERMDELLGNNDIKSLSREAHTLKGASLTFGCASLSHCAARLETAAHEPLNEDLASLFEAVQSAYALSSHMLSAEILNS